jgi:transposase-like protein
MDLVELKAPGMVAGIRWPDGKILCPACKSPCRKDGFRDHGRIQIQQYRCTACDRTLNEYTGTLLEGARLDAADLLALHTWSGRTPDTRPSLRRMARALGLSPETVRHWVRSGVKGKDRLQVLRQKSLVILSEELFAPSTKAFRIVDAVEPSRSSTDLSSLQIRWASHSAVVRSNLRP